MGAPIIRLLATDSEEISNEAIKAPILINHSV